MGCKAKKTEHSGAKHGNGAYWGPTADAKKEISKVRRSDPPQNSGRSSAMPCVRDQDRGWAQQHRPTCPPGRFEVNFILAMRVAGL